MDMKTLGKPEAKGQAKKPSYGKFFLMLLLVAVIFHTLYEQNVQPLSLSPFFALLVLGLQIILDYSALYFLVLWIIDLIRRRGGIDRPENEKTRMVINIIFAAVLLLTLASVLMAVNKSPPAELNSEQAAFVNQLPEKNKEFSDASNGVKIATLSLSDVLNNQEWSKMHNALQNLLSAAQTLQPKIDELKIFIQQAPIFSNEEEREAASLYGKNIDVRGRHNEKLIELVTVGLKIDWNNPEETQMKKWTELAGELAAIENEMQTAGGASQ